MTDDAQLPRNGPWAEIDCQAIADNLAWLRQRIDNANMGPPARIWAVVKANAYGHGLLNALAALQHADGLCVNSLDDAICLRQAGWQGPLLLLSAYGLRPSDLADPCLGELHLVIDAPDPLHALAQLQSNSPHLHAWLRYAGRLGGQGFEDSTYPAAFEQLQALLQARIIKQAGHLHHYAAAEDPQSLVEERQVFMQTVGKLPGPHSTGNSAALCGDLPEGIHKPGHWLRCGLLLYGASARPGCTGSQLGLRPAMHLRARLTSVKRVKAGQTVGYGDSYRAPRDTLVGTVSIGYSHGLPRCFWEHGQVLVNRTARVVPSAGRVAMDCLAVDLGPTATERAGDIVTVWGSASAQLHQPVETVATACSTIAAELFTSLTARVPLIARHPPEQQRTQ